MKAQTLRTATIAVCLVFAAVTSAAYASSPPGQIVTKPTSANAHDAWVKFAACMSRGVGIKVEVMPPPRYGIRIFVPALPQQPTPAEAAAFRTKTRVANAACHHFLQPVQQSSTSSRDEAKFRDAMLKFAVCVRQHGIKVGDPIITKVAGGFDASWPDTPGVRISGPRWQAAQKACRSLNPLETG